MFYSHDILQKRGGKFGVIWIAATKGVSLTKRDYCSVCVPASCDDIIKYITLRANPVGQKGSRPRFSLYLSSQLMVGVARIFEKQFNYFIVDVRELHKRTSRFTTACFDDVVMAQIQLKKPVRSADFCTMPESSLFQDDEFGVMRGGFLKSPDPLLLPEIEMFSVSPYRAAKLSTSLLHLSPSQMQKLVMESPSHVVSSTSEISLREEDGREINEIQIPDVDLPPLESMADMMTDISRHLGDEDEEELETNKDIHLSPIASQIPEQLWAVDGQTGQLILSPSPGGKPGAGLDLLSPSQIEKGLQLSPIPSQDALQSPGRDVGALDAQGEEMMLMDAEDALQAVEEKEEAHKARDQGLVTPQAGAVMQNILRLSPIEPTSPSPGKRRGRKRRLVFADATTQLSKKDIRHNMETVEDLARRDQTIAPKSYQTAKELFEEPARKALKLSSDLLGLWKDHSRLRLAVIDPEAEDLDAPAWSTAYMRPRDGIPGSSTEATSTSPEGRDDEEGEERGPLAMIPEMPRHEISASPERLRDISLETSQQRQKFEDTPQSIIISDASHLSESKDSFRQKSFHAETSAQRSLLRPGADSSREMEDAIPEELLDVQELPLLLEEELVAAEREGLVELPSAPEMTSTSEDEEGRKTRMRRKMKRMTVSPEKHHIPHENVLKGIGELTAESTSITFKDLVPPNTYRTVAAKIFSVCLEYAAMGLIRVRQEKPYAEITIQRGTDF